MMIWVVTTDDERACLMPDRKLASLKRFLRREGCSEIVARTEDDLSPIAEGDVVLAETKRYDLLDAIRLTGARTTAESVQAVKCDEDKLLLKLVLNQCGVATPERFRAGHDFDDGGRYFVKPLILEDSMGIDEGSLCVSGEEVRGKVKEIRGKYGRSAIIEEYVPGLEVTVGIINGKDGCRVMPMVITPNAKIDWLTGAVKEGNTETYTWLQGEYESAVERAAVTTFRAIGAEHYARIDMRVPKSRKPYVIEVNLYPGLGETGYMYRCYQLAARFATEDCDRMERLHNMLYRNFLCEVLGLPLFGGKTGK